MITQLPQRRNGLSAACEPCRKAKIRCDRAVPTCSRCRKRRTPSLCVFLAAPMTQSSTAPLNKSVTSSKPNPVPAASGLDIQAPRQRLRGAAERYSGESEQKVIESISPGFLGSSSFVATIRGSPGAEEDDTTPVGSTSIDKKRLELGFKVLSCFPNREACFALNEWYLQAYCQVGFHKPTVRECLRAFWDVYGDRFDGPRKVADLERTAMEICLNGRKPLESHDDPHKWIAGFTGTKTRWETLGTLLLGFCYACISLPDNELKILDRGPDISRSQLIAEMTECSEACLELCRYSLNAVVCSLMFRQMLLESVISGDTSLSTWRLKSELIGVATASGLHCYQPPAKVTLESELTKRLSASIFWADKELATFTGRPPSLSHRYCSCPLPLDLSDDVLMEGGEALDLALRNLDPNGWNTDGKVYDVSSNRMLALYAVHMDEIMEIFLGNESQWSLERVYALKARTNDTYNNAPPQLQIIGSKLLLQQIDDRVMWRLLCGRLDWLRLNFLLERLLTERGGVSKRDLLEVAREMLDLIVFMWLERDRSRSHQHDYDFMIMCYGMPSIGVLCTELLKQAKQPSPADIKLPRSEIVQNLSLMIGFLNWVKPTAGNFKLCRRMSQVIKRILDQFFDAEVEPQKERETETEKTMLTPGSEFEAGDAQWQLGIPLDDLEWLNSIDWTQGPYIDINMN